MRHGQRTNENNVREEIHSFMDITYRVTEPAKSNSGLASSPDKSGTLVISNVERTFANANKRESCAKYDPEKHVNDPGHQTDEEPRKELTRTYTPTESKGEIERIGLGLTAIYLRL